MTRIAYVYAGNAPVFGRRGASVHMQEVIRALTRGGGRVDIVARRLGGNRLPGLEETPVHKLSRVGGGGRGGPRGWDDTNREVRERLAEIGPVDLVYERFSLGSFAGMEHARATGAVGVLEMNGPRIEKAAARGALDEREGAEQAAAHAVGAAAAVVAVSEPVAEYARARFPGANVTTIPNGVDPGRFPPSAAGRAGGSGAAIHGRLRGHLQTPPRTRYARGRLRTRFAERSPTPGSCSWGRVRR